MAKQGREHAVGPYTRPGSRKWRIYLIGANGARVAKDFASEAEAVEARDMFNAKAGSRTVGEAVREYLDEKAHERGNTTTRYRLMALLRLREGDRPLESINAPLARKLYQQRTSEVAADTHQGELAYVRRFCDWCVERGWLRLNPFDDIKPEGDKRTREDEQLRINEARRVYQTALEEESLESLVVLMALLMGLRAHEVVERTVRDVDADGAVLWVPKSKTRAGKRQLVIPEVLRPALLALCRGKGPTDAIFVRHGKRPNPTRYWLYYHVKRLCQKAGVPVVTPHGLRRTWMTLGVLGEQLSQEGTRTLQQVAHDAGHADDGVTAARCYIAPGAIQSARTKVVQKVIVPLAHNPTEHHDTGVSKPYETRSMVMDAKNAVTSDDNQEVN